MNFWHSKWWNNMNFKCAYECQVVWIVIICNQTFIIYFVIENWIPINKITCKLRFPNFYYCLFFWSFIKNCFTSSTSFKSLSSSPHIGQPSCSSLSLELIKYMIPLSLKKINGQFRVGFLLYNRCNLITNVNTCSNTKNQIKWKNLHKNFYLKFQNRNANFRHHFFFILL